MRVGIYGWQNLVVVEGRLSAVCTGNVDERSLAPPDQLLTARAAARRTLEQVFASPIDEKDLRVRRWDPASELVFADGRAGRAFLNGCAAGLGIARLNRVPSFEGNAPEPTGVRWETSGQRIRVRMYDAGAKHLGLERGRVIRLELEFWRTGERQPSVEQLLDELPGLWSRRLQGWRKNPSTYVASPDEAIKLVRSFRDRPPHCLSRTQAARLAGDIAVFRDNEDHSFYDDRTRRLRLAELAALGVHLDNWTGGTSYLVELGSALQALIEPWSAA